MNKISMTENSVYEYVNNPDRVIFSVSATNPKIHLMRLIGKDFVESFSKKTEIKLSRYIQEDTKNQIVGAFIFFEIPLETMKLISSNQDLLDSNFIISSDRKVYCIIKKFLYTNSTQFVNTINEVSSYIDVYLETQLNKYGITYANLIDDRDLIVFSIFAGLTSIPVNTNTITEITNSIKNKTTTEEKVAKTNAKQQIKQPVDTKEVPLKIKKESAMSRTIKNSLAELIFGKDKLDKAKNEIKSEIDEDLKTKNKMMDIKEREKKLKEKLKNEPPKNEDET